jgi:hypothetical protein
MDEKELIELSDEIIDALTKLAMGSKPGFLSGSVYKNLASHPKFMDMKQLYIEFLNEFDGSYSEPAKLKKLTDFRFSLIALYQSK